VAKLVSIADAIGGAAGPRIRNIGPADLWDAFVKGFDDFKAKPSHLLFLVIIYPVLCFFLIRFSAGYAVLPLLFPLLAGYTLVGPATAVGMYEISRRRELGQEASWHHAIALIGSPKTRAIVEVSAILTAIFALWLLAALWIFNMTVDHVAQDSLTGFINQILATRSGWMLILIGNGVGFCYATVALAVGAISFPMILDKGVDSITAVTTSIRVMLANPRCMMFWGFMVAAALALGSLPFFVGLAVVWPVLGHSTWHLYRKAVES
jgi:uncharacterized membrane protein